jgi:hypothetical protein
LQTLQIASAPLQHCLAFLQKRIHDRFAAGSHLCQLVLFKGADIFEGFNTMLTNTKWQLLVDGLPADSPLQQVAVPMILELCTHHAACYFRRVLVPLREFPLALFHIVAKPHDVPCSDRQSAPLVRACASRHTSQITADVHTCVAPGTWCLVAWLHACCDACLLLGFCIGSLIFQKQHHRHVNLYVSCSIHSCPKFPITRGTMLVCTSLHSTLAKTRRYLVG